MKKIFLYRTTCIITGKVYIGVHSTHDEDDGYLGSGVRLRESVDKFGEGNHEREIITYFDSMDDAYREEAFMVDENWISSDISLNVALGGKGGWSGPNSNSDLQKKKNLKSQQAQKKLREDAVWRHKKASKISVANKKRYATGQKAFGGNQAEAFRGLSHSVETKKLIGEKNSIHQSGKGNSQYGTFWVSKDGVTKKATLSGLSDLISDGWKRGRK